MRISRATAGFASGLSLAQRYRNIQSRINAFMLFSLLCSIYIKKGIIMLKKLFAAVLGILMVVSMASCENSSNTDSHKKKKATTTTFTFTYVAQNTSKTEYSPSSQNSEAQQQSSTTTKSSVESNSKDKETTTTTDKSTTTKASETTKQSITTSVAAKTTKYTTAATQNPFTTTKAIPPMKIVNIDQNQLLAAYEALISGKSTQTQRNLIKQDLAQYTYQKYKGRYDTSLYAFKDASGKPTQEESKSVDFGNCGFNTGCSHESETTDYFYYKKDIKKLAQDYMQKLKKHIDSDVAKINKECKTPFAQQQFNIVIYKSKYDAMLVYDDKHPNEPLYVTVLCYKGW